MSGKKQTNGNGGLVGAIIFAALIIGGSLVFFGMQSSGGEIQLSDDALAKGIERYVQNQQQAEAENARKSQEEQLKSLVMPNDEDYYKGDADAAFTLIEYSDFECPFCTRFHASGQQLLDDGEINWVYRHFPLGFHDPMATYKAEAVECVGDIAGADKFWEMTDELFAKNEAEIVMAESDVDALGASISGDADAYQECKDSGRMNAIVKQDIADGAAAGVTGTPGSFIVNNSTGDAVFVPGALPYEQLKGYVDQVR